LPGFYDKVKPISNARRAEWESLGFDEAAFLSDIGLSVPGGERGYSAVERLWARPTADINGIWGGYQGQGAKTVIAAEASAKITFRLVSEQEPDEVIEQFKRFVSERLPRGCTVEFEGEYGSPAVEVNADSPWVHAARTALTEEYGKPAILIPTGVPPALPGRQ